VALKKARSGKRRASRIPNGKKVRGKKAAKAATAGLRAQTSEAIANLLAARQEVARAEHAASTSNAEVASSSKANELLNEQSRELENAVLELEDELAEENLDRDMASNASARKNDLDADYFIAGASADNERGRQNPYAARLAVHQILALGVSPSAVASALSIGGAGEFQGRPPGDPWVRAIRREMRVVVCTLAAATAGQPHVSFINESRHASCGPIKLLYFTFCRERSISGRWSPRTPPAPTTFRSSRLLCGS
jgi:hypothetical protein